MTVNERPLHGRVDLQRYVTTFTQNPAVSLWNPTSGAGFTITVTPNGSAATGGGTTAGRNFYSSGDGTMKLGRPFMRVAYTYTGLTVGRTYTYTARVANSAGIVRSRVFMGTAVSEWAEGKGVTTFTSRSVQFTATATSHVLGIESEAIADAMGVMVTFQTMNLTRNAWAQEQPGNWVTDGLADATNLTFRRGGSRTGVGVKTDVGLMSFTLHNAEDPLNGGTIQPGQIVRAIAQDKIEHPEVGHFAPGPDIITGYQPVVSNPAAEVYSHGFETYARDDYPAVSVYSNDFEANITGWTGGGASRPNMPGSGAAAKTGTFALMVSRASGTADMVVSRTFTGMTVGRTYTFRAWVAATNATGYTAKLGSVGIGWSTPVALSSYATAAGYVQVSTSFLALATSAELSLSVSRATSGAAYAAFDDVTLTQDAYSVVTNDGKDGWAVAGVAFDQVSRLPDNTHAWNVWPGSPGTPYGQRTFSGLTVGRSYTVKAQVASYADNDPWDAHIAVVGKGSGAAVTTDLDNANYTWVTHTFTASATSHTVQLTGATGSDLFWDNITLTRNAYTSGGEPIYGPGPDVWVVDEEAWTEYLNPAPLFTGRVVDVKSTYPLNKATGKDRTSVVVTVSDAVNIHGSTMRYGVQIAERFETFESRINRLASTALAPIEAPVQGAPREVYSF